MFEGTVAFLCSSPLAIRISFSCIYSASRKQPGFCSTQRALASQKPTEAALSGTNTPLLRADNLQEAGSEPAVYDSCAAPHSSHSGHKATASPMALFFIHICEFLGGPSQRPHHIRVLCCSSTATHTPALTSRLLSDCL